MKRSIFYVLFPLIFMPGCGSPPAAVPEPEPALEETVTQPPAAVIGEFDPGSISREVFDSTKTDVQNFIEDLNRIIRSRNYEVWISHLGDEYFAEKSSPEYLAQISEQPRLKTQKIVLNTARDYFIHVVVPSRQNDRVDDIEFVSPTRVKAYTVTPNGQRLRLYDLESSENTWKIIN
jgi:hypothetical protein